VTEQIAGTSAGRQASRLARLSAKALVIKICFSVMRTSCNSFLMLILILK